MCFRGLILRPVAWVICLALALIAAMADLYSLLDGYGLLLRLGLWVAVVVVGLVLGMLLRACLRISVPALEGTREDLSVAVSLALIYVPLLQLTSRMTVDLPLTAIVDVPSALAIVFGAALMASNIRKVVEEYRDRTTPRDRLFNRLDADLTTHVVRISSADHHVVVYLSDGTSHTLRMRLRDAVEEMDVEPGFCVHRSHWVALRSIASAANGGAKGTVQLKTGESLPIGPKYRVNLVEAGFLDP